MEKKLTIIYFSNSKIFLLSLVAFGIGIFLRLLAQEKINNIPLGPAAGFFWFPFLVGLVGIFWEKREYIFLSCILAGFLIGWAKTDSALSAVYPRTEKYFSGQGVVWSEPKKTANGQKMIVRLLGEEKERVLLLSNDYLNFQVGDVVDINCFLQNPRKIENWNYPLNLASQGIYQFCQKAKVRKVGTFLTIKGGLEKGEFGRIFFLRKSFAWRKKLEEKIYQRINFPESGFLAGLILGDNDHLDEETETAFRRAGLSHLVAVSGYNISLLGTFLMGSAFLLGFKRAQAFWLAVAGLIFFVLSIGSPISAVRAAIMGILVLYAAKIGRLANSLRMLFLAAAVMLFFSPLLLFYDVGFQLSFLATFSLVTLYAAWRESWGVEKDFLELKSIFLTTIAAQLGVLGILVFTFQTFSPVALIANFLILPLVPWLTLGGFGLILLEIFFPLGANLFAPILYWGLHWEIAVAKFFAHFSWAEIEIEGLRGGFLFLYYLFFWFLVWQAKKKNLF